MDAKRSTAPLVAGLCAATLLATVIGYAQAPAAPAAGQAPAAAGQGAAGGGRGGGRGGVQPQAPSSLDLRQMLAAVPEKAPATPAQPRRVLVLGRAAGFVHSSIPLAARTVEALGANTGSWTTTITFNPADINTANLANYDLVFLASTTGSFLDDPTDAAATDARKKALLDFVRGGKGLAGVHAATDSYHGGGNRGGGAGAAGAPGAAAPGQPAAGAGRAAGAGAPAAAPAAAAAGGGRGGQTVEACNFAPGSTTPGNAGGAPLWPEFNVMIGGYFKWHWNMPTHVYLKVDEPAHPLNAPFVTTNAQGVVTPRSISVLDEVYTFNETSFSRKRSRVLTSIDYSKMPLCVRAQEPAPQRTDHDYALSYIQKEGNGRVFVLVLGHDEGIYKIRPILEHMLAGIQYAIGDLKADDSPSVK